MSHRPSCSPVESCIEDTDCTIREPALSSATHRGLRELTRIVQSALLPAGVKLRATDLRLFIDHIDRSSRLRKSMERRFSKGEWPNTDIIFFICEARDAGDLDEALWRAFLAAHFGRDSASGNQKGSAARLLCGFKNAPVWTWCVVKDAPGAFHRWLLSRRTELRSLLYGNHRKYESKKPDDIWAVIESFIDLVNGHGNRPSLLFSTDASMSRQDRFDLLFERLRALHRFGRTGRFDFLSLLADLGLVKAHPGSCCLRGSTGPLNGARLLWGRRPVGELDELAADLARKLGVSPLVIEDALCNWQKEKPSGNRKRL